MPRRKATTSRSGSTEARIPAANNGAGMVFRPRASPSERGFAGGPSRGGIRAPAQPRPPGVRMKGLQLGGLGVEQGMAIHGDGDPAAAGGADLGEGHLVGGGELGEAGFALGTHAHDDAARALAEEEAIEAQAVTAQHKLAAHVAAEGALQGGHEQAALAGVVGAADEAHADAFADTGLEPQLLVQAKLGAGAEDPARAQLQVLAAPQFLAGLAQQEDGVVGGPEAGTAEVVAGGVEALRIPGLHISSARAFARSSLPNSHPAFPSRNSPLLSAGRVALG